MRLALQELSGQLKVFHHPSQRAAFLQQLVELAEEFYAYEIRPGGAVRKDAGDRRGNGR